MSAIEIAREIAEPYTDDPHLVDDIAKAIRSAEQAAYRAGQERAFERAAGLVEYACKDDQDDDNELLRAVHDAYNHHPPRTTVNKRLEAHGTDIATAIRSLHPEDMP